MTDYGHPCGKDQDCTLPNIHCAYPNCYKGKQQATRTTDADIDSAIREAIVTALPEYGNADRVSTTETDYAIYRAGVADGLEQAEKVCEEYGQARWNDYKHGVEESRGNPYIEGKSDGADECADAIRALKEQK